MKQSRKDVLMKYKDHPDREYVNDLFAKLDESNYFDDEWVNRSKPYHKLNWRNNEGSINKTIDILDLTHGHNLLIVDAGAGTGKISLAMAEYTDQENIDIKIYAIDQSYSMLEKCPEHRKIKKYIADIEHMTFIPDDSIDRIICSMVLHSEFERANNIIKEFWRILKKGGLLVIFESIPIDDSFLDFYMSFLAIKEKRIMFTKDELSMLINGFGNVVIEDVILERQSIKNWLYNSCTKDDIREKIIDIHRSAPEIVKQRINLIEEDNDIFCDWKFAIARGMK
jgi:ubiquinone/menaquinone biosynthesis C-methylase UbiE